MGLFPWQRDKPKEDFGPGPTVDVSGALVVTESRDLALGIKVKEGSRDTGPRFERSYSLTIDRGIRLEITAKQEYFGLRRGYSGSLRQSNGDWIIFEPNRIADKILDPVLLPVIKEAVKRIIEMDHKAMNPPPNSFVDDRGVKWIRASSLERDDATD